MTRARLRRPGALALLMVCFLLSGVMRVADPESALAGEIDDALGAMRLVSSHSGGKAGETLTSAEIDLLFEELKERETQLEVMRQDLATRAQTLAVTEEKLREQLEVLEAAEAELAATLTRAETAADEDVARLTTVYENMKPADAAQVFEAMNVEFAAGFLIRMRPDAAAKILAGLEPNTAYAVTVTMAGRNAGAPRE
ncbi:MAG: hypothetical protein AAFR57_04620 [Pseudomonadota bacterium]